MTIYKNKITDYSSQLHTCNKKYNTISILRTLSILAILVMGYFYLDSSDNLYSIAAISFFIGFFILMKIHAKLSFQKKILTALVNINQNEIDFLNREKLPFENGVEFIDFQHPYAYDLDIFGEHSLFQSLNRTATHIGKTTLANLLLKVQPNSAILANQKAIQELATKIDWRQEFLALAKVGQDSKSQYEVLLRWNKRDNFTFSKWMTFLMFAVPALFIGFIVAYFITSNLVLLSYVTYVFILNMIILGRYMKQIQAEISQTSAIDAIINQYSLLVQKIEKESFQSPKLLELQEKLKYKNATASNHLKKLSELFSKMDSINNFVTAIFFNGTVLFNLHVLKALLNWKKEHHEVLEDWLEVVGEFEALNSLANNSYNNPDFAFPTLNTDYKIDFTELSHPLLNPETRVGNAVSFHPQSFVILTGSNMSGKSTFLRSLGVNMVLGGIGAAVCATQGNIHPLPILVSMRLSDSLSDSESYFFAEIKRLKQIMDALEEQPAFVLLDEILRGTNSDDKRDGTIEVVKKVIAKKAIGAIATHDIEVCLTTDNYPDILKNQCFEVEIVNDDLHFDYKLRDGICRNKSATFLMQKMGVI
ncbi:DNA mismatch repair protein [Flavobacterium sp. TAB 87]|uniref:MutS-related protein n=1 Tax=Flavobacterium sp. TAB 87 TaxID=1729581 RepID=UPI00076D6F7C|nr:DNA mismatch repair protein [Flavobacterium sp. TAB 87]KVV15987.1 DNA mismatch repair protein MutS [Flavobacterium sp. TAB 87]